MIRTKFTCRSITKTKHWDGTGRFLYTASFQPVMQGSEENKKFFAATPAGDAQVGSFTENSFEVGTEYYLDFTPAV